MIHSSHDLELFGWNIWGIFRLFAAAMDILIFQCFDQKSLLFCLKFWSRDLILHWEERHLRAKPKSLSLFFPFWRSGWYSSSSDILPKHNYTDCGVKLCRNGQRGLVTTDCLGQLQWASVCQQDQWPRAWVSIRCRGTWRCVPSLRCKQQLCGVQILHSGQHRLERSSEN